MMYMIENWQISRAKQTFKSAIFFLETPYVLHPKNNHENLQNTSKDNLEVPKSAHATAIVEKYIETENTKADRKIKN